jgi:hypothetical protein
LPALHGVQIEILAELGLAWRLPRSGARRGASMPVARRHCAKQVLEGGGDLLEDGGGARSVRRALQLGGWAFLVELLGRLAHDAVQGPRSERWPSGTEAHAHAAPAAQHSRLRRAWACDRESGSLVELFLLQGRAAAVMIVAERPRRGKRFRELLHAGMMTVELEAGRNVVARSSAVLLDAALHRAIRRCDLDLDASWARIAVRLLSLKLGRARAWKAVRSRLSMRERAIESSPASMFTKVVV